jgi:hypothetical protein
MNMRKLAMGLAIALACTAPTAAMADTTSKPAPAIVENGPDAPASYAQRQAKDAKQLSQFEGGYVEVVEEHHPHVLIVTSVTTILLIALIVLLVA